MGNALPQEDTTSQLTVVIKCYSVRPLISNSKQYGAAPDYIDLQEQGERLLNDACIHIGEFDLVYDQTVLGNANTIRLLQEARSQSCGRVAVVLRPRSSMPPSSGSSEATPAESSGTGVSRGYVTGRVLAVEASAASGARHRPQLGPPTDPPVHHIEPGNMQPGMRLLSGGGFLVLVDGTIASGKTTLMNHLEAISATTKVRLVREPIQEWWGLLEELYHALQNGEDLDRRTKAVVDLEETVWRHHQHVACESRHVPVVSERGLNPTVEVFCNVLSRQGLLPEPKYHEFVGRHKKLMEDPVNHPTVTIYCRISREVAARRIEERAEKEGRIFEKGMSPDYLAALEQRYEALYPSQSDTVIIVDSNQPVEDMVNQVSGQLRTKLIMAMRKVDEQKVNEFMEIFQDRRAADS
mmetsp:Transcript_62780/g.141782  ORF Transcript_62780/g.141782 Transcript_62780/m.141782 type:complete len:410 (+) Transcript_62780:53-1282(+)|eukprot:CAMPEP_0197903810 /NCGR_PEP_ID=MMETSP1439-20131203/56769_1 /TAXON_ID=66791 /ORGANISM="Gonyaulax spinifera, Strain CCMP409" /LENGTH=409 /DNA_ID=CAMNT_0043524961 /DNA_START=53 /DNA_END=1282 /DNA_ORIENTATION=+